MSKHRKNFKKRYFKILTGEQEVDFRSVMEHLRGG